MSMNDIQEKVMRLLASHEKPAVDQAEQLHELASSIDLPPRVVGSLEAYITEARNEAERAFLAKAAADKAKKAWTGVKAQASRIDDLADMAEEAEAKRRELDDRKERKERKEEDGDGAEYSPAFLEGYEAGRTFMCSPDLEEPQNPHEEDSEEWRDWNEGWDGFQNDVDASDKSADSPYDQGYQAYNDQIAEFRNPFIDNDDRANWQRGYDAAAFDAGEGEAS